ncbi:MAG: hypothetical protein OXG98_01815 [Gemmatimonadetes bacterium]|nr:hypothetical protein [Gemmatimonadota bacterium]
MSPEPPRSRGATAITLRAGIIGLALSAVVAFWGQFSADHAGYNYSTYAHLPAALLIPFLILILGPHVLLRRLAPRYALTTGELIVVFTMGLIGSMVPDWGMTRYLVSLITGPFYHASPENRWAETFFDTLPAWLVISGKTDAVRVFYEGAAPGYRIPWMAWISPLLWWMSCFGALMWTGACIVVILRKQWVSHERLRFPLGEVALNLMGVGKDPNDPPMVRTTAFRTGAGLSLAVVCWNIASYWDIVTAVPIMGPDLLQLQVHPSIPELPIRLNVFVFCFAFFINAEILFSLCFFLLFTTLQRGVLNMLGITAATTMSPTGLVGTQSIGALIALVIWGLWMARRHLASVGRRAFRRDPSVDDSGEFFSYRVAIFGLLFGLLYLLAWLYSIGMSLPVSLVLLAVLFTIYLGMARIVAEAGLVAMDLPVNANNFTGGIIGADNLDPSTITALGMTNAFARNWRTFTMIGLSHAAYLQRWMGPATRHLFLWVCLAFAVSVVTSLYYYISAGYAVGADNLLSKPGDLVPFFYNTIMTWNSSVSSVSGLELIFFGNGIVLYMLMILGRFLFLWWPLHPIGLVAVAADTVRFMFLPFFLAWLIQVILLRLGGGALYRRAQPLFLGILVGYVVGMALSFLVDSLWFPAAPHQFESFIN